MVSSDELSSSVRMSPTPCRASMRSATHRIWLVPPRLSKSGKFAFRSAGSSNALSNWLSISPPAMARPSQPSSPATIACVESPAPRRSA